MNTLLSSVGDSYICSVFTLAALFVSILLLVKFLTLYWVNDVVLFGNPIHNVEVEIPKVQMSKIKIPFTFKLDDDTLSTYEGVHCIVSSEVCYRLEAYWGVSIADFHYFLRQHWDSDSITSSDSSPLRKCVQHVTNVIRDVDHDLKNVMLKLLNKSLNLGVAPRQYYPLVVFLLRDAPIETLDPDEMVALVNVVHIKDSVCNLPSSILAQYLKQANGRLTTLKQLYVASMNVASYDCDDNVVKKESGDPQCIVCQVNPISRALLPCRHTCICAVCFHKIYACPLCRSPITSYFLIRSEEYFKESDKISYSTDNSTFSQWFHDRITDFLGFER